MENQSSFCGSGVYRFRHLVKDAVPYGGTGLIAFINDAARTNISEIPASNTINFSPIIYPILEMIDGFPKRISLLGESEMRPFRLMLTPGAEWKIIYKPKLDETKMPKVIIPPGKEPARIEYPDGSID